MIAAIVCGAYGRMGQRVLALISEDDEMTVAGVVERAGHPDIGKDIAGPLGLKEQNLVLTDDLSEVIGPADVVIDFSVADAAVEKVKAAHAHSKPIVVGTTGFTDQQTAGIKAASKDIPCVIAPNMSLGVNVLFKLVEAAARILGRDFDIEISEIHHNQKKDAPSGTAMRLAEIIALETGRDLSEAARYGRQGMVGEREAQEIGIHAIRAGDVVGDHTVMFAGGGERLELTHRTHSRDNFSRGALRAAKFIVGKPPGMYTMRDVLDL